MTYEERLTAWARSLVSENIKIEDYWVAHIDTDIETYGYGGCDTCGWGGDDATASMNLYLGPILVRSFDFNELDIMLQGLLAV